MQQTIPTMLDWSSTFFGSLNLEVQGHFFNTTTIIAVIALLMLAFLAGRAPGLWAKYMAGILFLVLALLWCVSWQVPLSHPRKMTYALYHMFDQGDGLPMIHPPVPRVQGTEEFYEILVEVPTKTGTKRSLFTIEQKTKELEQSYNVAMQGLKNNQQRGTLRLRWEKSLNPEDQMRFYYAPPQVPPLKFRSPPVGGGEKPTAD